MRASKRRLWLGMVVVLALLVGACAPASILADNTKTVALSTPAPDLIIETITWSPENPLIGDTITFTVTIKNQGSDQADDSRVAYYIDDTYQSASYINQIDAGDTATKTFTWKAQAGSHTIKAVADANNNVTESDETNNEKTYAFPVLAPDLTIETITWSPENPSVEEKVTFTVTVKNQGNNMSSCSHVDFYIDGYSQGYQKVPRLDAGATANETFNWTAREGSHTIKAIADFLEQVSESDEINNNKVIIYSTAAPDLIIETITWSPGSPVTGDNVTYTVTLKNQGTGRADNSWMAYYINDNYQSSAYIDKINPEATVTKTFSWIIRTGPPTFKAVADANDNLSESDETNNTKAVTLPSQSPDLIIQNITWSPASPLIGHKVTFSVNIKNQGKTRSGFSRLYFYIDDRHQWQQTVPSIDTGATVTTDFNWTSQESSHTIKAIADAENHVYESNESNNVMTKTATFSGPPSSDLVIQDITWSPQNPSLEETVTFTVTIKNQGTVQADAFHVDYYIDETFQNSVYVNQINSGATATTTFTWTAEAGSHTFKAVIDASNLILERDDTNNAKTVALPSLSPDLIIQDITWSSVNPPIGDMVTFTVTIKNQGNIMANRSYVAYYIDGSHRGYHDVQEIAAGATVTKTFTWTAQTGSHTIKAVADMQNQILESDESNNEQMVIFPPPDLTIASITWLPLNPSKGDTVTFSIALKNQSRSRAGPTSIHIYIDGSYRGYENFNGIAAGATVTKNFNWIAQAGSHSIRAIADAENQVAESDESNNKKTVTFSLLLPSEATLIPAPASESTLIPTTSLGQQEAGAHLDNQISEVSPGQDTDSNPPEEPTSQASDKAIWMNWWFALIVAAVIGAVVTAFLRLRRRPR